MLVLVSFVLVLAAAVTLVVGLLQSGLTLIYLSIGCSVLAGVVLAVAVLRGRPEPRATAAPAGRAYSPPAQTQQVPASVAAPATSSTYETTTSWTPPPQAASPAPPPPASVPSAASPSPAPTGDSAATALLGRLRRRSGPEAPAPAAAPEEISQPEPEMATAQYQVVPEGDDGFPIANYDRLRATDLLRQLGSLDRNQLEAVRERESGGKNRFTIMSRVDVLLAGMSEPAWDADDDEWEDDEEEAVGAAADDEFATDADDWQADDESDDDMVVTPIPLGGGEMEDDEVDELVSPADDFPIAGYESLTVGQILPRLSDLDADQLAQVRSREQEGRARATILDRIDRLASKSGGMGRSSAPARRSARKAPVPAPAPAKVPAVRKARVAKVTSAPAPANKVGRPRKAAATEAPMVEAVKKTARKSAAAAQAAPPPVKKAPARRTAATPAADTPMKAAVKKARAAKKKP